MNEDKSLEHPVVPPQPAPSPALDFAKIAIGQRIIIFSMIIVLIAVAVDFTSFSGTPNGKLVDLGLNILSIAVSIVGVIYLGLALKLPIWSLVLGALAMFVPIVNLFVLMVLNGRAMKALKPAGYKLGFLGSSKPS
ncbi:MAG: hypothetical protein ACXVRK_16375 [Gaiellaceae bacterium]